MDSLMNQNIVFLGELSSMNQKEGKLLVQWLGGKVQRTINNKTTILICGMFLTKKEIECKDNREKTFELAHYNVTTISEKEFLILINQELVKQIRRVSY